MTKSGKILRIFIGLILISISIYFFLNDSKAFGIIMLLLGIYIIYLAYNFDPSNPNHRKRFKYL